MEEGEFFGDLPIEVIAYLQGHFIGLSDFIIVGIFLAQFSQTDIGVEVHFILVDQLVADTEAGNDTAVQVSDMIFFERAVDEAVGFGGEEVIVFAADDKTLFGGYFFLIIGEGLIFFGPLDEIKTAYVGTVFFAAAVGVKADTATFCEGVAVGAGQANIDTTRPLGFGFGRRVDGSQVAQAERLGNQQVGFFNFETFGFSRQNLAFDNRAVGKMQFDRLIRAEITDEGDLESGRSYFFRLKKEFAIF